MLDRPMMGREEELARLTTAFDAAASGRGSVTLIGGEAGIGKTRLAHELSAEARRRGAFVGWGRCVEAELAPAYWPLSEALDELVAAGGEHLGQLSTVERSRLATIVPAWASSERPVTAGGDEGRFFLSRALMRLLEMLGRNAPVVCVLDDVHAADMASLGLVELLAPAIVRMPVLLVLTHRIAEVQSAPAKARILDRLAREATSLSPTGLPAAAVAALLADRGLSSNLAPAVFTATQGNPLFVHEVATTLLRSGAKALDTGGELPIPWGVRDAVRERLARLGDDTRRVLDVAAIWGEPVVAPAIASISGRSRDEVASALAEATEAGVLDVSGRFTHPLLREVPVRDLPETRRAEIHRKVADHLAAEEARGARAQHARIARHLLGAGPGSVEAAARRAITAATQAIGTSAWEDAVALLERVLEGLTGTSVAAALRADVLLALGQAQILAARFEAGERTCEEAANIARRESDGVRLARAALTYGRVIRPGLSSRRLHQLLEESMTVLADDEVELRARVLARLAAVEQPDFDPLAPMARARQAIRLAETTTDPVTRLDVLFSAMAALADYADPVERQPLNEACVTLAVDLDDKPREFRGRMRLVIDYLELGRPAEARRQIDALDALAHELEGPHQRFSAAMLRAAVAYAEGDRDRAHDLAPAAAEVARHGEVPGTKMILELHAVAWRLHDGSDPLGFGESMGWQRALPSNRLGRAIGSGVLAALAVQAGDLSAARTYLAEIEPAWFERWLDPMEVGFTARAVAAVGNADQRRKLAAIIERMGERHESWGLPAMICFGPLSRHLEALRAGGRGQGAKTLPTDPSAVRMVLEGENWLVTYGDVEVRVRSRKGEQLLAMLVARPGEELHVLELVGSGVEDRDAGPVLDDEARRQYRARLHDLGKRLDAAKAAADEAAAMRIEDELEVLHHELARAFGLGGRARRAGSPAERARVAVRKRLREALDRLAALDPALGRHLERSVRTGVFCTYDPVAV